MTEQLLKAVIPLGQVNVVALIFSPVAMGLVGQGRLDGGDLRVWTLAIWLGAVAQAIVIGSHRWSGLNRAWERRYAGVEGVLGSFWGAALALGVEGGDPFGAYMIVTCFLVMTTSAAIVAFAGSRMIGFCFIGGQWAAYAVVAVAIEEFDLVLIAAVVMSAASAYLLVANRVLVGAVNAQVLAAELTDELRIHASTDSLTGLLNRRAFMEALQGALDRGLLPTVIFVDLDGFKAINDDFGHQAGDDVLVESGRRLVAAVRSDDIVGRLGGDEFVALLLNGLAEDHLVDLVRRIRSDICAPVGSNRHRVTASVGCAGASANESADRVLGRADALMYQAKQSGGDSIRLCHLSQTR